MGPTKDCPGGHADWLGEVERIARRRIKRFIIPEYDYGSIGNFLEISGYFGSVDRIFGKSMGACLTIGAVSAFIDFNENDP